MAIKALHNLKAWARRIKRDVVALWLAARDPRVPVVAKVLAGLVAAYALSPIDLIPDFIPVLGYLDDVILLPLGIASAARMIPAPIMDDLREHAALLGKPRSAAGLIAVVVFWLIAAALASHAVLSWP
ncbi:MAG: YkvA family protein [Novosphingobium sp.]